MIDTARRFFSVATILKVLDGMETAKLNVLHWHATDNEAFPLVLPSHPELAEAGAWTAHGHTYTIDDMKHIVAEARRRAIRVIVELDTPGHVGGFCRSHDTCVPTGYTGMGCLLDPSNPLTWTLLNARDTFSNLMDLFPDEQVMIGGDEVTASVWMRESKVLIWETQHNIGNPGPDRCLLRALACNPASVAGPARSRVGARRGRRRRRDCAKHDVQRGRWVVALRADGSAGTVYMARTSGCLHEEGSGCHPVCSLVSNENRWTRQV